MLDKGKRAGLAVRGITAHILVAEDDAEVRRLIVHILEEAGYVVAVAKDGNEAVAAVGREDFDLVILDVVMPNVTGPQAFEKIRALRPGMRCLFSTGYAPDLLPGLPVGAVLDVLQKPYDPPQLLRAVRRVLDRGTSRETPPAT